MGAITVLTRDGGMGYLDDELDLARGEGGDVRQSQLSRHLYAPGSAMPKERSF